MKRILIILSAIVLAFCFSSPVFAQTADKLPGQELAEKVVDSAPENAKELGRQLGIDGITPEKLLELKPGDFFDMLWKQIQEYITKPFRGLAVILAVIIFCAFAEIFKSSVTNDTLNGVFAAVSSMAVSAVLISTAIECIKEACAAVNDFSGFLSGYVPVFSSVITASGMPVTGGVYSAFMFWVCQVISSVSSNVLLPLLGAYLALSFVAGINPSLKVNAVSDAIKTLVNKILGLSLTVFVGMMSLQSLVATGSDTLAVKTGKYLIGNFIPVVGSAISDVFLSVQGCVRLMKTCIGWYAIVIAVLIFVPILVKTAIWRMAIYLAQTAAQVLDIPNIGSILNAVGAVFTMLIAIILTFALLIIVTTTVMLVTGMGG